jgi:hypothetical protein
MSALLLPPACLRGIKEESGVQYRINTTKECIREEVQIIQQTVVTWYNLKKNKEQK